MNHTSRQSDLINHSDHCNLSIVTFRLLELFIHLFLFTGLDVLDHFGSDPVCLHTDSLFHIRHFNDFKHELN